MSGLDKILEHITDDADKQAKDILDAARREADRIISSGRKEADSLSEAIRKQSELDVQAAVRRIQSTSALKEKRIILQAKQNNIEAVFADALSALSGLSDAEYFEVIEKMMNRYCTGQAGTILFNEKDLQRLPQSIKTCAEKHNLSVGNETADIIGGFILSYGEIEENCSFDVLIEASKEELQDEIGKLLYG